ncbi:MAG: flagellar biosynthesis anti-sigma factor FlgM [Gammaproteobacteria bacterium]|nr:MAG: flagellar biosynthesis anti-sigma factor FlgM [Gammaproteobacteria bacterium]PHR83191.1 MAG: flagellar biosynthesis anti-sigma factor FlgM [Colwellia sp.]
MTININNLNSQVQVQQNKQAQVKQQAAQSVSVSAQGKQISQDSVSLTPQAKQLHELQKKANDAPVVDQKKVDELKKAISAGEYKVDPQKLAASIANFEFDLI